VSFKYYQKKVEVAIMIRAIVRFLVSAVVLWLVAMFLPGVTVTGFTGALFAAVAIAAIGWITETMWGNSVSRQNRGFVGFIVAAAVIWLAGAIVPGFEVGIIGALLASFVIGLIDAVVPTTIR
jgi:putative membrane protein